MGQGNDSLLTLLNNTLGKKKAFDEAKQARIVNLKKELRNAGNTSLVLKYDICLKLYNEYKSFNYNEAFNYAQKLQQTGPLWNDPTKIAYSRI